LEFISQGTIDEHRYFIDPDDTPRFSQTEGLETTVLTRLSEKRMTFNATQPGHTVPMHKHPHEQTGMIYAGEATLRIGNEERHAREGDFYCIPAGVPHGDTTIGNEPLVILDIFHPLERISSSRPRMDG
jgi:quercetin dioxygenase-like cupin family protein